MNGSIGPTDFGRCVAWLWGVAPDHWYRINNNKTRQGYARKRILKLAGYLFVGCAA
jgi:hypothetical protein